MPTDSTSTNLIIIGGPGTGKSALSNFIFRELLQTQSITTPNVYRFICTGSLNHSPTQIVTSFLYDILNRRIPSFKGLIHQTLCDRRDTETASGAHWEVLDAILHQQDGDPMYFIIDGLDELQFEAQEDVLSQIQRISGLRDDGGPALGRFIITSRDTKILSDQNPEYTNFDFIKILDTDILPDIDLLLTKELQAMEESDGISQDLDSTKSAILDVRNNNFLWVGFALTRWKEHMKRGVSLTEFRNLIPGELDEFYADALARIPTTHQPLVKVILDVVSCLPAGVLLSDLATALNLGWLDDEMLEKYQFTTDLVRFLAETSCVNFLTIMDGRVCPAHHSAWEFLASSKVRDSELKGFSLDVQLAHCMMLQACLKGFIAVADGIIKRYSEAPDGVIQHASTLPFPSNVARLWPVHALHCGPYITHAAEELFLFLTSSTALALWLVTMGINPQPDPQSNSHLSLESLPSESSGYNAWHILAAFNQTTILQSVLIPNLPKDDHDNSIFVGPLTLAGVNDVAPEGTTALMNASLNGNEAMFSLLLHVGCNPLQLGRSDTTLIHASASSGGSGSVQLAERALELGVGIDQEDSDGETALMYAVKNGHDDLALFLMQHGAKVEHRNKDQWTVLHLATMKGRLRIVQHVLPLIEDVDPISKEGWTPLQLAEDLDIIELLIMKDANVHQCNDDGVQLLHGASQSGELPIIELLLKKGALPSAKTKTLWTCFHYAASEGGVEALQLLLESKNEEHDLDALTDEGCTALTLAATDGRMEDTKLLLQYGASLNVPGQKYSPLSEAVRSGNLVMVQYLISKGAEVDDMIDGSTPLRRACILGHLEVAKALLEAGASIDGKLKEGDIQPIHFAAWGNFPDIVDLLISWGANKESIATASRYTPLCIAAWRNHQEVFDTLLQLGCDFEASDTVGRQPIHQAAINGNLAMLEALLSKGADPQAAAKDGRIPLHHAIVGGHTHIVEALIRYVESHSKTITVKEYVNIKSNFGFQAVHHAAAGNKVELLKRLIAVDADPFAETRRGVRPLHMAARYGSMDATKFLIEEIGSAIDVRDSDGYTPLLLATALGQITMVKHLVDAGSAISISTNVGETVLHLAAGAGSMELLRYVLQLDFDIDARDNEGFTPLLNAINVSGKVDGGSVASYEIPENPRADSVSLLLDNGANPHATSNEGWTALHLAAPTGDTELLEMLFWCSEINVRGLDGRSPLHLAAKNRRVAAVQFLIDAGADVNISSWPEGQPLNVAMRVHCQQIGVALLTAGAKADQMDPLGQTAFDWAQWSPQMVDQIQSRYPSLSASPSTVIRRQQLSTCLECIPTLQRGFSKQHYLVMVTCLVQLAYFEDSVFLYEKGIHRQEEDGEVRHRYQCAECNNDKELLGKFFVCKTCPTCALCQEHYEDAENLTFCAHRGLNFLIVPSENWSGYSEDTFGPFDYELKQRLQALERKIHLKLDEIPINTSTSSVVEHEDGRTIETNARGSEAGIVQHVQPTSAQIHHTPADLETLVIGDCLLSRVFLKSKDALLEARPFRYISDQESWTELSGDDGRLNVKQTFHDLMGIRKAFHGLLLAINRLKAWNKCKDGYSIFVMGEQSGRTRVAKVRRISTLMLLSLSAIIDEVVEPMDSLANATEPLLQHLNALGTVKAMERLESVCFEFLGYLMLDLDTKGHYNEGFEQASNTTAICSSLLQVLLCGLVSYVKAHANDFTAHLNVPGDRPGADVAHELHASQYSQLQLIGWGNTKILMTRKSLACMHDLVQQPIWTFQTLPCGQIDDRKDQTIFVSMFAADLEDLWGPVFFAANPDDPEKRIVQLHLGRGYVTSSSLDLLPEDVQTLQGETYCHFQLWPEFLHRTRRIHTLAETPHSHEERVVRSAADLFQADRRPQSSSTERSSSTDAGDVRHRHGEFDEKDFQSSDSFQVEEPQMWTEVDSSNNNAYQVLSTDSCMLLGAPMGGFSVFENDSRHPRRDLMMTQSEKNTLEVFATSKSRWTLDTVAFHAKVAPFDILSSSLSFKKLADHSMKEVIVENFQSEDPDPNFLEYHAAIELSVCTRIARRVPLYKVFQDRRVQHYLGRIMGGDLKTEANASGSLLDAFSDGMHSFKMLWYTKEARPILKRMIKLVLGILAWTGRLEDRRFAVWYTGKPLVWPLDLDQYSWIGMVEENEKCAAFMYLSDVCLDYSIAGMTRPGPHPTKYIFTGIQTALTLHTVPHNWGGSLSREQPVIQRMHLHDVLNHLGHAYMQAPPDEDTRALHRFERNLISQASLGRLTNKVQQGKEQLMKAYEERSFPAHRAPVIASKTGGKLHFPHGYLEPELENWAQNQFNEREPLVAQWRQAVVPAFNKAEMRVMQRETLYWIERLHRSDERVDEQEFMPFHVFVA